MDEINFLIQSANSNNSEIFVKILKKLDLVNSMSSQQICVMLDKIDVKYFDNDLQDQLFKQLISTFQSSQQIQLAQCLSKNFIHKLNDDQKSKINDFFLQDLEMQGINIRSVIDQQNQKLKQLQDQEQQLKNKLIELQNKNEKISNHMEEIKKMFQ